MKGIPARKRKAVKYRRHGRKNGGNPRNASGKTGRVGGEKGEEERDIIPFFLPFYTGLEFKLS